MAPGTSLGLFSFVFDDRLGPISFQAVFANPTDPENPLLIDGVTRAAAASPTAVPEPTTLLLVAAGLAGCRLRQRRGRQGRGDGR